MWGSNLSIEEKVEIKKDKDNLCLFNKIFLDNGTTAQDVNGPEHPLYKCKVCVDPYTLENPCEHYTSLNLYRLKKLMVANEEVSELRKKLDSVTYK